MYPFTVVLCVFVPRTLGLERSKTSVSLSSGKSLFVAGDNDGKTPFVLHWIILPLLNDSVVVNPGPTVDKSNDSFGRRGVDSGCPTART